MRLRNKMIVVLTAAYFIFILGTAGGSDRQLINFEQSIIPIFIVTLIWFISIAAVVFISASLKQKEGEQ